MISNKTASGQRDSFRSSAGFMLACIGSAVGMGNIWLFPARVSQFGGATFLIPYILFVIIIASTGVIGEMAFGRATSAGPLGAFGRATEQRWGKRAPGRALALIPTLGSLALAIGYSVVVGWILKYAVAAVSGRLLLPGSVEGFGAAFDVTAAAFGSVGWHLAGIGICFVIMIFGIAGGIERANKIMMPLFFFLFAGLAIYIARLPGASDGYRYLTTVDFTQLANPKIWLYALGQAFFTLSIAGSGTLVYGSYLKKDADIPRCSRYVAFFDTLAAIVAALVIIPAMAVAGQELTVGGPGLMFVYLPAVIATMPGGPVIAAIFFVAVLFAGMTSLMNLLEAPIELLQHRFGLGRKLSVTVVTAVAAGIGVCIEGIVSGWMDICSIYICPIGALLAGVLFFWVCKKHFVLEQVNLGARRPIGNWFYPLAKYGFCILTLLVLVLGAVFGGIG